MKKKWRQEKLQELQIESLRKDLVLQNKVDEQMNRNVVEDQKLKWEKIRLIKEQQAREMREEEEESDEEDVDTGRKGKC